MPRILPLLLAFFLVLGAGVAQGLRTDRWALSLEPAASAAKLDDLPLTLGDWKGTEKEIDPGEKDLAEIVGYKFRTYRHARTGKVVQVIIMCGRPGPIAVHTPDICFGGAGYVVTGEKRATVSFPDGSPPAEFKTARFVREGGADVQKMRILWGWSTDGTWSAPDDPRLKFASSSALFKLYVMFDQVGSEELSESDTLSLIRPLLTDLRARLAPAS